MLRLLFIHGSNGFKNDVSSFEAWALTLAEHPLREFYAKAGFADYPPGYFFILWLIGHAYKLVVHNDPSWTLLKYAVKLPAVVMDLVDAWLLYAIVRRVASLPWAFAAAAFFAFNPAAIFISAYWGQVDSVAAGFVLAGLWLLLIAHERTDSRMILAIAGRGSLLGYSILIKPPATVLVPLWIAYAFGARDAACSRAEARAAIGTVAAEHHDRPAARHLRRADDELPGRGRLPSRLATRSRSSSGSSAAMRTPAACIPTTRSTRSTSTRCISPSGNPTRS